LVQKNYLIPSKTLAKKGLKTTLFYPQNSQKPQKPQKPQKTPKKAIFSPSPTRQEAFLTGWGKEKKKSCRGMMGKRPILGQKVLKIAFFPIIRRQGVF